MLAPIEAAWMFLKSQPTERDARINNERMEPFHPNMVDSHWPHMRGEEEGQNNQEVTEAPTAAPPRNLSEFPWQEGPTLGEMADMDPEEVEHYRREAGRRSTENKRPSDQPTLHDY